MFSEVEIKIFLGVWGTELTEAEGSWFVEHQVMIIDSYPFQIFPQPSVDPVRFSCQVYTNQTFLQREALGQS